jgi:hypothetical protein
MAFRFKDSNPIYGEGTPKQSNAEDEGRLSCRTRENGRQAPPRTRSDYGGVTGIFTVAIIREDAGFADARRTILPNRVSSWLSVEVKA